MTAAVEINHKKLWMKEQLDLQWRGISKQYQIVALIAPSLQWIHLFIYLFLHCGVAHAPSGFAAASKQLQPLPGCLLLMTAAA